MPSATKGLKPVIVYVPPDLHAELTAQAGREDSSVSRVARRWLVLQFNECPICGATGDESCIDSIRDRPVKPHTARPRSPTS